MRHRPRVIQRLITGGVCFDVPQTNLIVVWYGPDFEGLWIGFTHGSELMRIDHAFCNQQFTSERAARRALENFLGSTPS